MKLKNKYTGPGLFLMMAVFFSCSEKTKVAKEENYFPLDSLVTVNEVGAGNMPDTIAEVHAPFKMPGFKRPVFPERTISIREKGAQQNRLSTKAIQEAIDEISKKGGGRVVIPEGKWRSGRISLKSNVNLHLEQGAELYFSGALEDYRPAVFTRHEGVEVMSLGACIYAYKQDNIAITGKGTLYGPEEGPVKDQMMTEDVTEKFVPVEKPVEERVYEGYNGESIFLPMFISPTDCTNVYIEGITLERSAFWNIVPVYCDGVIIRGVTVNSVGIPRGDGIDIESSRNVLIEYSTLNNGDDCFTMKAGRGKDGIRVNRPTENVVVRYCLAKEGHGGITVGSETAGKINNLYIHDCVFDNTGVGIRFKTRRPRGGGGENFIYERIRMNLRQTAFRWDMLGSEMYVGDLAKREPFLEVNELTPKFKDIHIKDILVTQASTFVNINGIPESPLENLLMENIRVENSKRFFNADDAKNLRFKNVYVASRDSLMKFLDTRDVIFEDSEFRVNGGEIHTQIKGDLSGNIQFKNTSPSKPQDWEKTTYKRAQE
ncbi:glycoside hydrolase family 28 protein [Sinomicrobium pectinilyticum]|uniref:Glycoside hydrolase family 28 protein n=1 Tax=Sinomicrobium pectinilyticum TaxID=1084421 RepID=A0A3N0F384_SINP1|nr:glycoside hydrolase family 28 protein [Sinomicrobium pectinilyticum]RNL94531.1 glycoside hydrolase family 28 protein [Sinomicrobium pectinilyticum]